MTAKGIVNPWIKPQGETPQQAAERAIEEAPEGAPKRDITFDGRAFHLRVSFYSFEKNQDRLSAFAHDALGRAISDALKVDGVLLSELKHQSIFLDEKQVLAAKVTVRLGPVTLYVKASSFDPKTAQIMAMDRIGLALANARNASAKVRKCFDEHELIIARKV
jgi:hypothetical protein